MVNSKFEPSTFSNLLPLSATAAYGAEESADEGSDPGYLDMINALENGGYDKDTFLGDYDYSMERRIDPVLVGDISDDIEDNDYPLDYHEEVINQKDNFDVIREVVAGPDTTGLNVKTDSDEVTDSIAMKDIDDRVYDYDESSEILETIVGSDGFLNMNEEDYHYDDSLSDSDNLKEEAKMIQISLEDLHDQTMIFHIILLLGKVTFKGCNIKLTYFSGIVLICVVVFFAVVTLVVTILTRRQVSATAPVRSVKVKTDGIIKTYAKIPVEIKNMVPSNVAYKQLYDV